MPSLVEDFCNKLAKLNRGKSDQNYPIFLLYNKYKFHPVLIFDDLFSELDEVVVNHVIQVLIKVNNQIFITSTSKPSYSLPGKCIKID